MQKTTHRTYAFGEFTLDLTRGCLLRDSSEIKLRPKSFDVLKFLVENGGRLVGKEELIQVVWQETAVTDDSLVQCLKDIRNALDDRSQTYIKTVPRRGYIFEKEVAENGAVYIEETSGVHLVIEESEETNGAHDAKTIIATISESKAAVLLSAFRRHKLATAITLGSLVLITGGIAYGLFVFLRRPVSPFKAVSVKQLTNVGNVVVATISPDGNYVAYVAEKDGRQSLWIRQVVATEGKEIVAPDEVEYNGLSFSPDGNFVYYSHSKTLLEPKTLYQVPTSGGTKRKLFEGLTRGVTISPDGKQLAFVSLIEGMGWRLMVANADGTGEPQSLAVRKSPEVFTPFPNCGLAWSPDGKTIAVSGGEGNKFGQMYPIAVSVSDGTQKILTKRRWQNVETLDWLADGSGIVMSAVASQLDSTKQLWHVSFPSGVPTRLNIDTTGYGSVSLAVNSDTLAAVQGTDESNISAVTPNETPDSFTELTAGTGRDDGYWGMATTLDGKIVYDSKAGGSEGLWIMGSDGSNQKQLTFESKRETNPSISPDGQHIVFASVNQGIWQMDIDGSNRRQLAKTGMFPRYSADGQSIFYTQPQGWKLFKVPAAGGDSVLVIDSPAIQPAISPDGKLIAYMKMMPRTPSKLVVVPVEGGEPLREFEVVQLHTPFNIEWTPDGKAINYNGSSDGVDVIWNQPLDGSPPNILFELKSGRLRSFAWSPDGKKLYFASGPEKKDVVLFSLTR